MPLDWNEINRMVKPCPNYEDLAGRLSECMSYPFVRQHYNLRLPEAAAYAGRLLGCDPRRRYEAWLDSLQAAFGKLAALGVPNIAGLIGSVENREKLEAFLDRSGLSPPN